MDDLAAMGWSLELLVKDNRYTISSTQANLDAFKTRILSEVEQIQIELISIQKTFVQFK